MTSAHHPILTGIIATLGPASESPEMVRKLIEAGVSVFRLNFSHGLLEQHAERLRTVRAVARELGTPTAVLGDLQGPKIRVGVLPDAGVMLETGDDVLFVVSPRRDVNASERTGKELEASLLGALILDPRRLPEVARILPDKSAFREEVHAEIYAALLELERKGTPSDLVGLLDRMRSSEALAEIGGAAYMQTLAQRTPGAEGAVGWAREIAAALSAAISGGAKVLPCEYAALPDEVRPGHRVLINDGAVRLLAIDKLPGDPVNSVRCRVTLGGKVTSSKGINLPDSDVKAPAVTERDWQCVEWAVSHGLDFLALSFVRRAEEVRELRKALAGMCSVEQRYESTGQGAMIPVVAKIEKPQALEDLDSIVQEADAIMVARGDLGVEMDLAQVPIVQKLLLAKCNEWGKPCIVATQMLETMIENTSPTRAEVSDVAHAVFDGADAVMLSGETAVSKHPVLVVEMMRRTIAAAEAQMTPTLTQPSPPRRLIESRYRTAALAHGAWYVAHDLGAKLVVCWSQKGGAARYLSQNGYPMPIIAYSSDERETRRMALLRGVTPMFTRVPEGGSLARWNEQVDRDLIERGWADEGDPIVLIAGRPLGEHGAANTIAVHHVGNSFTGFRRHE